VVRRISRSLAILLALIVLGPPAAHAAPWFTASEAPVSIDGEQQEKELVTFVLDGQKLTCNSSFGATLTESVETLQLNPTLKECLLSSIAATVELKECKFKLHGGKEVGEEEFSGTEDISCPGSNVIVVKAGTCVAEIGSQSGLSKVTYESDTQSEFSSFKTSAAIKEVKYTTKDGFLCPFSGSGEKTNGEITGTVQFTGSNEEEAAVSVALSTAVIDPFELEIPKENETRLGAVSFGTEGKYKIWEQNVVDITKFELVDKAGEKSCTGVFQVNNNEIKPCFFKVKSLTGSKGSRVMVITKWAPDGATQSRRLESWVFVP
jgi:hypothetical protein